jgi:hypothetical protein
MRPLFDMGGCGIGRRIISLQQRPGAAGIVAPVLDLVHFSPVLRCALVGAAGGSRPLGVIR